MERVPKVWFRRGKNGKGLGWYIRHDGRQIRVAPADATEEQAVTARDHFMLKQGSEPGAGDGKAVQTVLSLYTEQLPGKVSAEVLKAKTRFVRNFCQKYGGRMVKDLRPHDIETWLSAHPQWGVGGRSGAFRIIRAAFRWLFRRQIIMVQPWVGIDVPRERPRGAEACLNPAEFERIVDASPLWLRRILLMLRLTGARPSEILTATAAEFDPAAKWIDKGTAHKCGKLGMSRRILLPPPAITLVEEAIAAGRSDPLFANRLGRQVTPQRLFAVMRAAARRAGVDRAGRKVYPYQLRHSFATELLLAGTPPVVVAGYLGHRGVETLMKNYSHVLARIGETRDYLDRQYPATAG